jgi:predicted nucleotidyltransferase
MSILSKNQVEILGLFEKNIFLKATIRELMHRLKKKSYQRIYESVNELEKRNMLRTTKHGNATLCELSLSPETVSAFSFLEEQKAFATRIPNIRKILEFKEFRDDILLVTGSYAKGTSSAKSDIDLAVITKENAFNKQKLIENLTALFTPSIHPIVMLQQDFIDMLLEKKENYGKEILKNRLLLRNSARYFELIKEAIDHGLRG